MSDDAFIKQQGSIQPPKVNRGADIARAAAKAALGAVPLAGAALAEAADFGLPNPTEADRRRWEGDVTDGINNLHGRVGEMDERSGERAVTFSGAPADIARFMIERCPDGLMRDDVTLEQLREACPDYEEQDLIEALGDLESYGLVEATEFLGGDGFYNLTAYGYEVLDPPIMGWNPVEDARRIAALIVAPERCDSVTAMELESELGWSRRRFNPALRIVLGFIHPGRIDDTIQPYFPACGFFTTNAERSQLRRFATGG